MTRLRDSSGFSLVEVLIAALILVVGAGAAFSLIDSANRSVTLQLRPRRRHEPRPAS